MKSSEFITEVVLDKDISRYSIRSPRDMVIGYNTATKQYKKHSEWDVPELPDHTVVLYSEGNNELLYLYLIDDESDQVIAMIELINDFSIGNRKAYYIDQIKVVPELQGRRIGPTLYKFIVTDLRLLITSGATQSVGAAKMWMKLYFEPNVIVKGYDYLTEKTFNVTLDETGTRLISANPKFSLYCDDDSDSHTYLIAYKG